MAHKSSQDRLFEIKRKKEKRKRGLIILGIICGFFCLLFIPTQLKIWQPDSLQFPNIHISSSPR
jgi:hypothetical protein